jgi:hypothetical protein
MRASSNQCSVQATIQICLPVFSPPISFALVLSAGPRRFMYVPYGLTGMGVELQHAVSSFVLLLIVPLQLVDS